MKLKGIEDLIDSTYPKSKIESAEYMALANVDGELTVDFFSSEEDLLEFTEIAHESTIYIQIEEENLNV